MNVPRPILVTALGLIVFVIALAALARPPHAPRVAPTAERQVSFADRPDGSIAIFDGRDGHQIASVAPRTGGFVRGVLRGMFRTRKLESAARDGSFNLVRAADGRLALEDPETGRRVDLESFGPENAASFARLLAMR